MQLVINTYGSYLRKNGNCFLVKKEDKSFEVAVNKVNSILITTAASITTDAIKLAIDNNIDIVFLDSHGEPYGRVWHPKLGSTTLIRRRQLEIYENNEGLELAKEWGLQKLENQIELLEQAQEDQRGEKARSGEVHRGHRALKRSDAESTRHSRCQKTGHAWNRRHGIENLLRGHLLHHA